MFNSRCANVLSFISHFHGSKGFDNFPIFSEFKIDTIRLDDDDVAFGPANFSDLDLLVFVMVDLVLVDTVDVITILLDPGWTSRMIKANHV